MSKKSNYEDVEVFLKSCDEEILRYLELQLEFAKDVRHYQLQYGVSNEEFAAEYGCSVNHVLDLRRGSLEIKMSDLAKLRTIQAERYAKDNSRIQINK